ncbi:MAG: uracil-DNA glycosylase family protein [Cyclobacteriaceae bacterium]
MTLSDQILAFYQSLNLSVHLPKGIEAMNPYQNATVFNLCDQFYHQFYSDTNPRKLILGINPGRLGGGTTGIPFTDPVKLEKYCNIQNTLTKKTELSADFIYAMIEAYGGAQPFYSTFFVSAVCPLGFTLDGLNLNYYDHKKLEVLVRPFIIDSISHQLTFPVNRKVCFCLGEGKNFQYLEKLNATYGFFKKIIPLPHPRFIMQYRRKRLEEFVRLYLEKLKG